VDWEERCAALSSEDSQEIWPNIHFVVTDANDQAGGCEVSVTGWIGTSMENALAKRTLHGQSQEGSGSGLIPESFITEPPENDDDQNGLDYGDDFLYGSNLEFSGDIVEGPGATIVIQEGLKTPDLNRGAEISVSNIFFGDDVKLNSGSASLGSSSEPGIIFINGDLDLWEGARNIYGDVYVKGDFQLKDARIYGNVYVEGDNGDNGDVKLGWTPWLADESRIYYTGSLSHPNNYDTSILDKVIKVDNIEDAPGYIKGIAMPDYGIPEPRSDEWYADKGYASSGILVDDLKIFADSYVSNSWRPAAEDVVIVSKGDISITGLGGSGLTGVLFAPYGKVTFNGGFFTGTVIARDGFNVTSGGTTVTFKSIEDFFDDNPEDIPMSVE
jgi:hypothetical protein